MGRTIHVTEKPVELDGYQAILKPSQYGHSLSAVVTNEVIKPLEAERGDALKWAESKLKNPKRSVLKPEPWEQVQPSTYKIKFSWNEESCPFIIDSQGNEIKDKDTPLYSSSLVKLMFYQKPYVLKDGVTYGTSFRLLAIQAIKLPTPNAADLGEVGLTLDKVREMFGNYEGGYVVTS